jgi:uroporphyrin-III C-methyltransferase
MTPLMVAWRLEGQPVLVVGGGKIAGERLDSLTGTGARVTVLAPELGERARAHVEAGRAQWVAGRWTAEALERWSPALVLAAIDDPEVSAELAAQCRAAKVPVNVADRPALCDFWYASVHREGPLQIAVSTSGAGPALASRLRREVGALLPRAVGPALDRFRRLRQAVRAADAAPEAMGRRMGWLAAVGRRRPWSELAELEVDAEVDRYRRGRAAVRGRVSLVGAGPGDPELLTVAAVRAIATADLVLADRLVPTAVTDLATGPVRVANKVPGRADAAQAELHRWMLDGARRGLHVVRVKCGDPFVFGRGGEELAVLEEAGVPATVVPGISSALAAPLLADIPATQRGLADRLVISTGRGAGGADVAPPAFHPTTTAVFLMSVGRLAVLMEAMVAAGWPADWPAAAVERASQPGQRSLRGTVGSLARLAAEHGLAAPAVIVVGRVCGAQAEAVALAG